MAFDGAEASPEGGGLDADGEVLVDFSGELVERPGDGDVVEAEDVERAADGGAGGIEGVLEPGFEAVLFDMLDHAFPAIAAGTFGEALEEAFAGDEGFNAADGAAAAAAVIADDLVVADFAVEGEGGFVELPADDGSAAEAVAEIDEEEIMVAAAPPREFAEGEGLDFLDEEDGGGAQGTEEGTEVLAFGPVEVGGEEDAAGVLVDNAGGADEDAPEFSGELFCGGGLELCSPSGGGVGGIELDVPAIVFAKAKGFEGGAGVGDAELNQEETGAAFIEAEKLAGATDAGSALGGLDGFEDALVDKAVYNLARGDGAGANGLGELRP